MKINFSIFLLIMLTSCRENAQKEYSIVEGEYLHQSTQEFNYKKRLSEYEMFENPLVSMIPKNGVEPYDLNSSLFSDYAMKKRFIYLPEGQSMKYREEEAFEFPEGSIIFKFFYYPKDFRSPEVDLLIIETRLLLKENNDWTALTYVWDTTQTDGFLSISGENQNVSWVNQNGKSENVNYSIPNLIQCKSCHEYKGKLEPIGPAARHLNKDYNFTSEKINQLSYFSNKGWLKDMLEIQNIPKIVNYEYKETGTLDQRARAYLDVNCAHCHRKEGPAKNSALNLLTTESNPISYGVYKTPIAAGIGSGGFKYDILPGKPDESILLYRMKSLNPGIMMPELGRKMNHNIGIELISEWITNLK